MNSSGSEYPALKKRLARGWNTWNTRSVLSHVLLPEGFAVNLGLKDYATGGHLREALIGEGDKDIKPGIRTWDGSYTQLNLKWHGIDVDIESAVEGDDLVLLVTPLAKQRKAASLTVEIGMLWNRNGCVTKNGDALLAKLPDRDIPVYATKRSVIEPYTSALTPYLTLVLDSEVAVSTGKERTVDEIKAIISRQKSTREEYIKTFGDLSEIYSAVQTCMAWDTIYDPLFDRVISPVSRIWNCEWGGYVLFCWDTYFAGMMAAIDNKDLAYANVIEITHEHTENGFVPNFTTPMGAKSRDRSQPPVGSMVVWELYQKFGDKWLLEEVFGDLLTWNRWWVSHRRSPNGLLCWGSDPYTPVVDFCWETAFINEREGAAMESGLDNSPMYDDIPFDRETHMLRLEDVGLLGLYIRDCKALSQIATVIERKDEADELLERAMTFSKGLQALWDNKTGIFLNRRTDTGEFTRRLSPTNFYPMLAGVPTSGQAERMIAEHFDNPEEFAGEWIIPSIARNDPAYPDQNYMRGRIWAPMNFLVYMGMRDYDLPRVRKTLVEKSRTLLLKEWREMGHVHENYNAYSGLGCDVAASDKFYHWGGLLGLISFVESGYFD